MFNPESYTIAASLFPRLLGLIYFAAFGAFLFQIKGLIGKGGILPLEQYLKLARRHYPKTYFRIFPTLFWLNSSDTALMAVTYFGAALSLLLALGVYPPLMLILLYVLYLSIVSAGQDFLSFGWEGFLLEITINAFFLSLLATPNLMVWISINLLLFRFHFQAGAVKLQSQDPNWRNLTAIAYHYQTQPLPNTIAWYAHKLPMWFHKLSTLIMFICELIVPFLIFGNEPMRLAAFVALFGLQFMIWITGNLSYLNHLTAVFCLLLIGNGYFPTWFDAPSAEIHPSIFLSGVCTAAGIVFVLLQLIQLWQHFFPNRLFQFWLAMVQPFYLANRYGIFAVMTTTRYEVVFEGSDDGVVWKEYQFYYKPSEISRRPRRISPYQPRLDWQAWFLPLGSYRYDTWFEKFLFHLLKGSEDVIALIGTNPFSDSPPQFVRSVLYEYEFSSFKEKKEQGVWWQRKFLGIFTNPVALKKSADQEYTQLNPKS